MFTSARYSYLALRLGLAAVFLWWGIDQFRHPAFWLATWLPDSWLAAAVRLGWPGLRLIFVSAVFLTLTGLSLLADIFSKSFALLAIIFLCGLWFSTGLTVGLAADVGLIGGLLAVLFWPAQRSRF